MIDVEYKFCGSQLVIMFTENIEIFGAFLTKQKTVRYGMHSLNAIETFDIEFKL